MEAPGLVVTLEVVLERLRAKFDPAIDARLLNLYQLGTTFIYKYTFILI